MPGSSAKIADGALERSSSDASGDVADAPME
jgi:hypothetical protein